ncbi:MAG: glycosyltransferase [Spirochaetales bacterium]|nr:glycosyltransferase [Spirochaetales bacterium]
MNIAGLVLTFNRKALLPKTLDALIHQSRKLDRLIVINNASTDGTDDVLKKYQKELAADFFTVVTLPENIGSSGGFSRGMEYIVENTDCDWIYMMDDDAISEQGAAEKFDYYYSSLKPSVQKKVGILQNERCTDAEEFKSLKIPTHEVRGRPMFRVTFEGYLIKTEVIRKIGYPRQEFFIYSDDIDYTWRAIGKGFKVFRVLGNYIYHKDWAKLDKVNRGIVIKPNIPPWKLYYVFRNVFLIFENNPVFRFFINLYLSIDLLFWSFINPESGYFARKGLIDGKNLVSGKIVSPESVASQKD